jgi:hypothetical protein
MATITIETDDFRDAMIDLLWPESPEDLTTRPNDAPDALRRFALATVMALREPRLLPKNVNIQFHDAVLLAWHNMYKDRILTMRFEGDGVIALLATQDGEQCNYNFGRFDPSYIQSEFDWMAAGL